MELILTEKYGTDKKDFEIYTFRNNNKDCLVIEPSEIANARSQALPEFRSQVAMNGNWNLKPHEYPDYKDKLAAVKQSLIIYSTQR